MLDVIQAPQPELSNHAVWSQRLRMERRAVSERPNGAGYKIVYDMFVPPHVFLVQGGSPQEMAHTRSGVTLDLPPDFDNGEPIKLMIPPGDVTLMIRRITDDYAAYAAGVKLTITPEV
jgi:hypothetical protein